MASVSCVPYAQMWCVPAAHTPEAFYVASNIAVKKKNSHQIRIMPLTLTDDRGTELVFCYNWKINNGANNARDGSSTQPLLAELLWNMKLSFQKGSQTTELAGKLTHLSGCLGRGRRSCNILWADVCRSQCRISLQSAEGKKSFEYYCRQIVSAQKKEHTFNQDKFSIWFVTFFFPFLVSTPLKLLDMSWVSFSCFLSYKRLS